MSQAPQGVVTIVARTIGRYCKGRYPEAIELCSHEFGMGDTDAKSDGSHPSNIGNLVGNRLGDQPDSCVIRGIDIFELQCVVTSAGPSNRRKVRSVMDSEVM